MLKRLFSTLYESAMVLNDKNVARAMQEFGPFPSLVDIGCWDGVKTLDYARAAQASSVSGLEVVKEKADEARTRGVAAHSLVADRETWPFADGALDCVVSNQVIEQLADVDHFFAEASRVLKPGGCLVTSTNNLASWHNIASLVLGWAPFDLTNSTRRAVPIGNPMALHQGEASEHGGSWCHKCIYTARWLDDWSRLYGLEGVRHYGAGYYPLPSSTGALLKRNCAFITVVARKR